VAGVPRLHRMIRRGTAYGPMLPEGVLEDDGADRGLMFAFVGAHLGRQFEFVQSEWINGGEFLGLGDAKDPVTGRATAAATRSRAGRCPGGCAAWPSSSSTRGGEYAFMPGLRALRWLAELKDEAAMTKRSDVLVIGAGPAGVMAALRAGDLGARTTLLTSGAFGGMAANDGPVPVRTLAQAARLMREARQLGRYGIEVGAARWTIPGCWPGSPRWWRRWARRGLASAGRGRGRRRRHRRRSGAVRRRPYRRSRRAAVPGREDHPLRRRGQPTAVRRAPSWPRPTATPGP
jgi:hypothetical protein